jgi:hypothetical protein
MTDESDSDDIIDTTVPVDPVHATIILSCVRHGFSFSLTWSEFTDMKGKAIYDRYYDFAFARDKEKTKEKLFRFNGIPIMQDTDMINLAVYPRVHRPTIKIMVKTAVHSVVNGHSYNLSHPEMQSLIKVIMPATPLPEVLQQICLQYMDIPPPGRHGQFYEQFITKGVKKKKRKHNR